MLFFLITTQDTYMHSWGAMFIQDVVLPFRKNPFTPKKQILLLRLSIGFVAVFAFIFGLLFKQTEYILMFFAITGAIVTGAGACIVLGVYWPCGTPAGAWTSMTLGWVLALGRIALQQFGPHFKGVTERGFWLRFMDLVNGVNSQVVWFWIMLACLASYVIVSLLTRNEEGFSMERMLHRGKYEVKGEHVHVRRTARSIWLQIVGLTDEFTLTDRILAYVLMGWNGAWFVAFLVGTVLNLTAHIGQDAWARFWHLWMWMQLGIGVPATIWFTIGGIRDLRELFRSLRTLDRDDRDDGRVVGHHLASESDK
jgi:SSS family solute:Na+ symporter